VIFFKGGEARGKEKEEECTSCLPAVAVKAAAQSISVSRMSFVSSPSNLAATTAAAWTPLLAASAA